MNSLDKVVQGGYCVGCGVCAAFEESISMDLTNEGRYQANLKQADAKAKVRASSVCPFATESQSETQISQITFGEETPENPFLGRFRSIYACHAAEEALRHNGSSGGMTTLFLTKALELEIVDAVVHVTGVSDCYTKFQYSISRSKSEILNGAKTRYYSVQMKDILAFVLKSQLTVAIVGVPCFIKAVRNLAEQDENFKERLKLTVSIFCGHMKSHHFMHSLLNQVGLQKDDIATVDFRYKIKNKPASDYGFAASLRDGRKIIRPMKKLLGRRWDAGFFRLTACNFCDDVVGETADISFGDAWIQPYSNDWKGHNIAIIRSEIAVQIFHEIERKKAMVSKPISVAEVVSSQGGGFRDRRDALAYRLFLKDRKNEWRPEKRVLASSSTLSIDRKLIHHLREYTRLRSFNSYLSFNSPRLFFLFKLEMNILNFLLTVISKISRKLGSAERLDLFGSRKGK